MTEIKRPIYLDYMSTTPVDPSVIEKMLPYFGPDGIFANPSAVSHQQGQEAARAIDNAREEVASLINAQAENIIWTSGATEANNLALFGAARFYQHQGKHIITMNTEHRAVLDPCQQLQNEGFTVTYLTPEENGFLDVDKLKNAMRDDTILVSIMHANNEIGVIQDIHEISKIVKAKGALLHVDAAQSVGKIPVDVKALNVDLLSMSAHKVYGPKGIGALYIRSNPRVRLQAILYGGGQEQGLRSGTLPTQQIVGMGAAFSIAKQSMQSESEKIKKWRDKIWSAIKELEGVQLNGDLSQRLPGNLNFSVNGVEGKSLQLALHELSISSTSACMAASHQPSYVLRAIGLPAHLAYSSIRLSLGRFTTDDEVSRTIVILKKQIQRLYAMAPSSVV